MKPLHDLVVVELAGSVAGAYCAKMFADGGAAVTVVGDSTITLWQQQYLHAGCQVGQIDDIDFDSVDVVIESSAPSPLVATEIAGDHLVRVRISPFGPTGDRAHWHSTDLTDYAISGHAYLYGDPQREPLKGPPDQPAIAAGLYGFVGALAALLARKRLGGGQTVAVSHVQVMVAMHQVTLLRWLMAGDDFCRMGNRYTGQGQPNGPYQCQDGWVSIVGVTEPQVEAILAVTGLMHLLDHPDITSPLDFQVHPEIMDEPLTEWLSTQRVDEVVELFQAMRIPTAPLLAPAELLEDPQLLARNFFQPLASNPDVKIPGPPFSFGHQQERGANAWQPGGLEGGPLAGLKVLDLARVWAGPLCAQLLGYLGAEVVWVEAPWQRGPKEIPQSLVEASHHYPNDEPGERHWNRNGHLVKYSLGKKSLALDLQTPAGQAAFARLVPKYHVLLENFSPRVMPQFGLGEEQLHELNPDLIYVTMPGYGRTGPAVNWLAYGSCVDSHAGLSSLIGYADATPWKGGVAWPDPIAGLHATAAILSALWSGQSSGKGGLTIEAAQFESTVAVVGDRILEAQLGAPFVPDGNRNQALLAQGVYRCQGEDNWIAISVPDESALQALAEVLDTRMIEATDHDHFDEVVTALVADLEAGELAGRLQRAGVAAAKVSKAADVMADPHLASIRNWETVDQPDVGDFVAPIAPISMSGSMPLRPTPAPTLGEHNAQVLTAAGFTADEVEALRANNIIATEPPA